jgi:hypothetical protein
LNRKRIILFLACLSSLLSVRAQYRNIEFVENKGQWDPSIRFLGQVAAGAFYVQEKGFSVLQHDPADWAKMAEGMHRRGAQQSNERPAVIHSHLYKVEFLDANEHPQIIPDKSLDTYNNYFIGNDPGRWAGNCKLFLGVTVKNIYPNVDIRYYSDNGNVKYDLVIHPGADLSRVAMKYTGAGSLELKNKELVISTSVGELKEKSPSTYQFNEK